MTNPPAPGSAGTIAFFSGYSLPHVGGIETYTRRIAVELVRRGYRVIAVSSRFTDTPWRNVDEGIEEVRLPILPIAKNRYPVLWPSRRYRKTMAWLAQQGVDRVIVNTRFHLQSLIGARFGQRLGVPVALVEHGSAPLTLHSRVLDWGLDLIERVMTRAIRSRVDGVYGVSQAAAAHVEERFDIAPSGVWYNCIDLDDDPKPDPNSTALTVCYVGRLIRQKGVDTLLAAFEQVRRDLPDLQLRCLIAGEGAFLPELQARYGQVPGVEFLGRIPQPEVAELLRRADISVYAPSVPEGLPSSLLEAGAARCAVIASAQGGITELIRDGDTGLLVEPNPPALAAALRELLVSAPLRRQLGANLHAEVAQRFATGAVVDQMLADLALPQAGATATTPKARSSRPLRVLHLLGTNRVSGAENVILTIMDLFRDGEVEMTYCSPDGPIRDAVTERGLTFLPLPSLTPWGLRKVLRAAKFDVIHAHDFRASQVAAMSRFSGQIVAHIHSNPRFVKSWNPLTMAYRVVCDRFSRMVFVSDEATRGTVFVSAVAAKTRVIPNVVDAGRVKRLAAEASVPSCDVVFLGRLTALKRPGQVIETIALARQAGRNLTAHLVGDGELRAELEQEIARRDLADAVTLLGFQANPYPYLRAARVAMMPSTFEGLPLAAIEALALGVPVLNSGAGGLGDLFCDHPQFICRNPAEYAARLAELADPEVYQEFQDACHQIVRPYIDLDRYHTQIAELYT
ncbi:MAG: glycosyltransferase [Promicromonosporaceae bacterium]|nr:glycosyltransferase [Promicromonosporaceae bacterium]